ncbi:MAG: glycosyltransferase [Acidobacteria bacterium]|nr:glycosyltransferase [Acidobacteriota bacterium]
MRLAFFSPLAPKPSGITDYSQALLPHLAEHCETLDVFIDDYEPAFSCSNQHLAIRNYREFEPAYERGRYDTVLYQMGNNPFHVYMYELALRIPGIVVMHEFNLHHLFAHVTVAREDWDTYLREMEYNGGAPAVERAKHAQAGLGDLDYNGIPMNRRLLEQTRGIIVHSDYVGNLVREAGFRRDVTKIPHGVDTGQLEVAASRTLVAELTGFRLDDSTTLFGIFGFLKPYKRVREALRAFARVRERRPNIKMILVGEEHPTYPLRPLINELGISDDVRIVGYVPLDVFTSCIGGCDICINLRRPTVGETSGSLLRLLALGKPTLISEIGAFLEIPEDAAIRIPVDDREVDWVAEYMNLILDQPTLARTIGERAREYAVRECSWSKVAAQYAEFLKHCATSEPRARASALPGNGFHAAAPPPLNVSTEQLEDYIMSFSHDSAVMEDYVLLHRKRLARSVEITPPGTEGDRILELGCYLHLTPALRKYLGYGEVRGAYYGPLGNTAYRATSSADGEIFACPVDLFDAEKDTFPYPDGYFQAVLCCELIEHLAADPMHMLAEINRVLSPGGTLILSTPNISSLHSVHAVLHGYHPGVFAAYIKPDKNGVVDPRHSREYTPRELVVTMNAAGFEVDLLETGDYESRPADAMVEKILRENGLAVDLRGEVIFCRGRKVGPVRERWPRELYYP